MVRAMGVASPSHICTEPPGSQSAISRSSDHIPTFVFFEMTVPATPQTILYAMLNDVRDGKMAYQFLCILT